VTTSTWLAKIDRPPSYRREDVVIAPAIKDEDIPSKFPKGHKVVKPYLRTTPQPNL